MEERVGQEEDPSIPSIEFDAETKKRIIQPWKQCLIGKVVGKTVGYKYISAKTKEMWRLVGKMQILDMGSDYFMFKFEHQDDFKHALLEGPWFINGHNLSLQRWKPNFKPSEARINKTIVWARLPELPIEYFYREVLYKIAAKIGIPIKIDNITESILRGKYARFCVELDTDQPLKYAIRIGNFKQRIEYEGIGLVCFHCGKLSHRKEQFPLLVQATNVNPTVVAGTNQNESKKEAYGPWMLVSKRNHKIQSKAKPNSGMYESSQKNSKIDASQ
ncbi:hypothetical protein MKX03_006219, partial [Papaver bracteatum]